MRKEIAGSLVFIIGLSLAAPAFAHHGHRYRYSFYYYPPKVTAATASVPASNPTPAPISAPTTVSPDFATSVEQHIVEAMNAERVKNNLAPLASDAKLAAIARAHSKDMLASGYFSHTNQSGCNAGCRLNAAGYLWWSYGENIYSMSGYDLTAKDAAQKIVSGWMNSSGHRANILGSTFTHVGVGIAVQGSKIYATANYTRPR